MMTFRILIMTMTTSMIIYHVDVHNDTDNEDDANDNSNDIQIDDDDENGEELRASRHPKTGPWRSYFPWLFHFELGPLDNFL